MSLRSRVHVLERQQSPDAEEPGPGISAVLAYFTKHQCGDDRSGNDDDEGGDGVDGVDGLRRLLREARESQRDHQL